MLSVKECREILAAEADRLSDEEIIMIRDWLSLMAEIAIESLEKSGSEKDKANNNLM